ncbi:hypothetical protein TCDM_09248 [Trypanosoma cruzi Dm28c]|uniref:Uncharacterized protein n=1 Tax=Trypanosoma cruzi Dm28c TaxID=1416333 RepID=V5D6C7_TRYCR|nr:hypothetical protein TCDM_09248 [Trypanosoma cruzi Dm28c]
MCTVSLSLPPVPLPENSSVAVAHSQTRQKPLVFPLPLHIARQHRQTKVTPSLAGFPQTRLPPHASAHRRTHQHGTAPLGASSVWTHKTGCPSQRQPPPGSEAGLVSNNQTTSPSSPPSAMHEVLPAPYIICDARTLNQQTKRYGPLDSTRSPLTILSQSSPWAMHEEHHGKNAQELICKTLNSFHVNKQCGTMPELHNNFGWRFPERPPINTARGHSKEKATPPIWLSPRNKQQGTIQQNAANHHIFHTDHRQLMQQMHSTKEESCPQTRNTKTQ